MRFQKKPLSDGSIPPQDAPSANPARSKLGARARITPGSTQSAVAAQFVARVSSLYRGKIQAAMEGRASPQQAIRAKCLECCGYTRAAISDCTVFGCPLWAYRPYQHMASPEIRAGEYPPRSEA